jgi:hypothetical protein
MALLLKGLTKVKIMVAAPGKRSCYPHHPKIENALHD